MNWKEYRRTTEATSADEQIEYIISKTRKGRYYIKAYLAGGQEHRLSFQSFETTKEAQNWVKEYEAKRAEQNARYAEEEPIRL